MPEVRAIKISKTEHRTHGHADNNAALIKRPHRIEGQVCSASRWSAKTCIDILAQIGAVSFPLESAAF